MINWRGNYPNFTDEEKRLFWWLFWVTIAAWVWAIVLLVL